jgi:hypothetical protein
MRGFVAVKWTKSRQSICISMPTLIHSNKTLAQNRDLHALTVARAVDSSRFEGAKLSPESIQRALLSPQVTAKPVASRSQA